MALCHNRCLIPRPAAGPSPKAGAGSVRSSERSMVFVHMLPSLIPPGGLRHGVAVVIDVLRASTMIVHALVAGCAEVIPCAEVDQARSLASGLPEGSALLAGERHGVPIPGFDLGNSPGDCTPERCRGK